MAAYSSGPSGGLSFGPPHYNRHVGPTYFTSVGGINPLDANTPLPFIRILGQQFIIATNMTTGFSWAIEVAGGYNSITGGYLTAYDSSANYVVTGEPLNCTIVPDYTPPTNPLMLNNYTVTTNAPDSKTYYIQFSPLATVAPLITLESPGALGADNLVVKVIYYRFRLG